MQVSEKLDLVLKILGDHSEKLDEQGEKLDEQGKKLDEQGRKLDEQGRKLDEQGKKLDEQGKKIEEQGKKLEEHGETLGIHGKKLDAHSELLRALIHGQQEIKAELDGFKLETFKRFDDVNIRLDSLESKQDEQDSKFELLEKRTWTNESDIHRLKKLIGIK